MRRNENPFDTPEQIEAALPEPFWDGGPAFPLYQSDRGDGWSATADGMSLRDYFAATVGTKDLAGIHEKASREELAGCPQPPNYPSGLESIRFNLAVEAGLRYAYADAMLKARMP